MKILEKIKKPSDLDNLNKEEIEKLCEEIREEIITVVKKNGGHLASSLGAVELTVGIHMALDMPKDKIVWDVGHQCYAHKLLTGRQEEFKTLRSHNGMSGFPRREESEYDTVNTGHASTAVSTALGLSKTRDLKGEDWTVVAVVGDGSLSGGLTYEGLNQAGHLGTNLIVVLNDNEMSIGKNVGALSSYLSRIRNDVGINKVRDEAREKLLKVPALGSLVVGLGEGIEEAVKQLIVSGRLFEEMGFRYIGPIDGHDTKKVTEQINFAKKIGGPVLLHVRTKKGKGYLPAEQDPSYFHGVSPSVLSSGKIESDASSKNGIKKSQATAYTKVFGQAIVELAETDKKIVAITAAMSIGTGLVDFEKKFPDRFFDVGIAEEHAVTFAAGLALGGMKPVVAIYSTFLQRAYDQLIHDVALTGLPVIFILDRAGLVGEDGPTHHGVFDLSYLKSIPGMTIMAPSDEQELRNMFHTAISLSSPVAIRFPRGKGPGAEIKKAEELKVGKARVIKRGKDVLVLAVGRMVESATKAAELLKEDDIDASVVDVRFVKPFDEELLEEIIPEHDLIVVLEESSPGGFSDTVSKFMIEKGLNTPSIFCHIPDRFVPHGSTKELLKELELDPDSVAKKISTKLKKVRL